MHGGRPEPAAALERPGQEGAAGGPEAALPELAAVPERPTQEGAEWGPAAARLDRGFQGVAEGLPGRGPPLYADPRVPAVDPKGAVGDGAQMAAMLLLTLSGHDRALSRGLPRAIFGRGLDDREVGSQRYQRAVGKVLCSAKYDREPNRRKAERPRLNHQGDVVQVSQELRYQEMGRQRSA